MNALHFSSGTCHISRRASDARHFAGVSLGAPSAGPRGDCRRSAQPCTRNSGNDQAVHMNLVHILVGKRLTPLLTLVRLPSNLPVASAPAVSRLHDGARWKLVGRRGFLLQFRKLLLKLFDTLVLGGDQRGLLRDSVFAAAAGSHELVLDAPLHAANVGRWSLRLLLKTGKDHEPQAAKTSWRDRAVPRHSVPKTGTIQAA